MSNHATAHAHSIPGPKTYATVLGVLILLTGITVTAAGIDFGSMNTVIALLIATLKASLVALFFMHLRHDRFNLLIFLSGLFFLTVFLVFTLFDVDTRKHVLPSNLKEPILEFPGAPLNKPIQPSTGLPLPAAPPPAKAPAPAAPANN
jgi:cytochrome c oxidase subunit 4